MRKLVFMAAVLTASLPAAGFADAPAPIVTVDQAVEKALSSNGQIGEAQGKVAEYEAKLSELEALYYPRIWGLTFVAPMYTVRGTGLSADVERRTSRLEDWGPYTHFKAQAALPLYTFGRLKAGETAAEERAAVEKARLRDVRNAVALEVKRYYHTRLFALSMLPPLRNGLSSVRSALAQAQTEYEEGSGTVTQVDLSQLEFGISELEKHLIVAEEGESLALSALKHTMSLPFDSALAQADARLTYPSEVTLPALATFLVEAAERRPEWAQIKHGKKATLALADAERLANAPVLFLGGEFQYDWTPMRTDDTNPYHYDPYNGVTGGLALGLQFDLNPWAAKAKTRQAEAMHDQVLALQQFAKTGIPLQVKKAYDETRYWLRIAETAERGSRATQKWSVFAFAAFKTGTGDAKDALQGLASNLQARRAYFEALLNHRLAYAELEYAVGRPSSN